MDTDKITNRQRAMLYIIEQFTARGVPPSIRELSDYYGITVNAVHQRLVVLKTKGYVTWEPNQARTLRIVSQKENRGMPLVTLDEISTG